MRKKFSVAWKRSVKPRKQRKYLFQAPLHLKQKMMHVHLSSELRTKFGVRNVQLRKGDKIKVLRGQYVKKEGKVERVNLKRQQVYVNGVDYVKKDGNKVFVPLHPSNLMIIDLVLDDKKRKLKLETKKGK